MTSAPAEPAVVAAEPAAGTRLRGLDGLRFVAAFSVLGYHYTGSHIDFWGQPTQVVFPTLSEITRYGFLGVHVFFVISGFVILMTAWDRPLPAFVSSRVARLYPAYWAVIGLTLLLQHVWTAGRQPDARDALLNLTMLQKGFNVADVQGAFWTLWFELLFYLLVGAFVVVGITRQRVVAFALLLPLLSQLAVRYDSTLLATLTLAPYAAFFAVGMLLFLVHRDGGDTLVWLGIGVNLVLCADYLVRYAEDSPSFDGRPVSGWVATGLLVGGVALVWLVTSGPLRRLDWGVLSWAGALTYPLYLVHGQFGFAVIDRLHGRTSGWAVLALATAVALVLAVLVRYAVEKPLAGPLRRAVRRGLEKA